MNAVDFNRPILLVEDNPADVDLTLRAFAKRRLANPVHVARDGEEAVAWIPRWEAGETLPLLILPNDTKLAIHISSVVSFLVIFATGCVWGIHTNANPWKTGLLLSSVCLAMVLVAKLLGG